MTANSPYDRTDAATSVAPSWNDDRSVDVLQVVTDDDRRGAQVFARDLHEALETTGVGVRTVALARGASGGLDVPVLGERRLGRATLAALRRECSRASVVVAHGSTTLPACAIATLGTRAPFVYRQISDSLFWAPRRSQRLRVSAGLARAAAVVALWSGSARTLETHFHVARRKLHVIPNGVPTDDFAPVEGPRRGASRERLGLDPARPTALSLGALVPEKGVDLAIDAIAARPDLQLLVVGDGPERRSLEARAAARAPGRVRFTGPVASPRTAYEAADVVILPSRGGDSMPAVLIEAGLMALPSIATPVGGIPEIVIDGHTGALVPVGALDELVEALDRITGDAGRAAELGEHARRHCVERFGIDTVATQWSGVLRAVARS